MAIKISQANVRGDSGKIYRATAGGCAVVPTVLYLRGWRFHFYSNEGAEPIHIHAQKGEAECKYWLDLELYDIREAYAYNMII